MHTVKTVVAGILIAAGFSIAVPAGIAVAADASILEYPYVYKSTRAMGMGGAYTAVGGGVDTLFYNPAGLSRIPKDKGWEINLLTLSGEFGDNALDFADDLKTALDTPDLNGDGSATDDQLVAVNNLLAENLGKNMHARPADFTSVGRSYDSFSLGLGAIASGTLDAMPHQGFGPEGLLEISSDVTYGAIGGISLPFDNGINAGLTVKALHRESLVHSFTARELVEQQDTLYDYITNDLRQKGDAVGFDAGLLWTVAPDSAWRPSVGVSVLNIGDLDFGDAGLVPMTVNAGVALNPRISTFRSLILGADIVDVTKEFEQDKDLAKRIRYGAELQLFDKKLIELSLRAGMYEGYPTLGAELRTLIFAFSYAMYSEEIGAYAGQDRSKRHLLTFVIGW